MSKVLFWSPYHGLGQTSNIHATSMILNLLHKKQILLMQTHFKNNNLESPLVGYNVDKGIDNNEIFQGIGLDMAVTYSNMKRLTEKTLCSCCLTPTNSMLLLPGTETKNRETYDRDIGRAVSHLIKDADDFVNFTMIDANSGNDELSIKLMNLADLIVINLSQRRYVLDKFFNEYGDRFVDKTNIFYLFGDYDDNSVYNINNCRMKYGKYIKQHNSGVIPYCTKYMDALNECNVIKFMQDGLKKKSKRGSNQLIYLVEKFTRNRRYDQDETDYFFHRAQLSVEKMLVLLQRSIRKDQREGNNT
jgi:hypothetical protein